MPEEHLDPNLTAAPTEIHLTPTQTVGPCESVGTVIDRYVLLQKIGEGGMGEVWLAEQREPVRRRVALKLVKAGMNRREVIARFESERQALALMDHPAIAKVFDAGSTAQGTPYFVMEYVAGMPITAYCDRHRLNTRDRLELFMRVCEGVQHAHQKAIIHRDLKPSNILVAEVDGRAAPKIIDFGIAKALTHRLTMDTVFTRIGVMVGTPEYVSPEQALSSGEDIDTRSDVYSLGIVFYELLAGAPPLDLRKLALEEFLRRLREDEPPKPSTKLRTQDPATSSAIAGKRQTEPVALVRQIRGDLDSIALKALEKDRSRRYGSPSDLAADIERYLRNEAVLAVPPSAGYRARKFVRRYRVPLATIGAFCLVLVAAAAVSIRQSLRADREAAAARAVSDFLQNDLLAQASSSTQSPGAKPDPDLKVRTALDRAAARIEGKFVRQPEVEAAIRETIGETYRGLGLYPEARRQLERALDLRRRVLGVANPATLETMRHLGWTANDQGKSSEAEGLYRQALEISRRARGGEHPDTLAAMNGLADVYYMEGKYAEAEALSSQALEIGRRVQGPEHPGTLESMNNLAKADYAEGKYPQAESLYRQALEIRGRVSGPEHPETLALMSGLANVYYVEGKLAEAEANLRRAMELQRRVLGPEHPGTLNSTRNLAGIYYKQGKYAESEALYSQVLEIQRHLLGAEHPAVLNTNINLAIAYIAEGRYAQAEALHRQTLEISRRVLGAEHRFTLTSMSVLAEACYYQGKWAQAEELLTQSLETERRVLGPAHPYTLDTLSDLGSMNQRRGKYDAAETYAAQALAGQRRALGPEHPDTMTSATDLALAYLSQGKFAESEALAREAVGTDRKIQPEDWHRFRAETLLGASLSGQKKYADAEPLLLDGYLGMLARKDRMAVPDLYHLERAREWLVGFYEASGRPAKAAEWKKK